MKRFVIVIYKNDKLRISCKYRNKGDISIFDIIHVLLQTCDNLLTDHYQHFKENVLNDYNLQDEE